MNNQFKDEIKKIDTKIIGVYLLIASALLYLVVFNKEKAEIIDKFFNTNYKSKYPNTDKLSKIIIIILLIANGIFLYYTFQELKSSIERYEKTGNQTSLDIAYNSFYANLLQFIASVIVAYNIFVKGSSTITIVR